jgi:hypothetical protein
MGISIQKTTRPRAIAKEKDGLVLYWVEELQVAGLSFKGLGRLLDCGDQTIANLLEGAQVDYGFEAETVTEAGLRPLKLISEIDLSSVLLFTIQSKCKSETRKRAGEALGQLAAAGFKLLVMLELAPKQLAAQTAEHSRLEELRLRKDILALEDKTLSLRHYVVTALPKPVADRILGVTEVSVVETRTEVIAGDRLVRDGSTIQKGELCRRYGLVSRTGKPDYKRLSIVLDQLPSEAFELTAVVRENEEVQRSWLPELDRLFDSSQVRQRYIGE